jgi:hypothetical protein
MRTTVQLLALLLVIGAGLPTIEGARRHLACVRFEQDLHRGVDTPDHGS